MGWKRVRVDNEFQSKKCAKRCIGDDDRISWLTDNILLTILSFLSLKEAACTSVLSYRWMSLWKHTSCLNFDTESAPNKIAKQCVLRNRERQEFVKWVNCIIRSHKAVALEEFTIYFDLRRSAKNAVTRWLEFAFARHVQKLELDFSGKDAFFSTYRSMNCALPEEFLTRSNGGSFKSRPRSHSSRIDIKSLKALSLKYIDVTGEAIQFFLRNCPLLEKLVVSHTTKISNLEVCGPSLVLKHLELSFCNSLESLKVFAPNLTSLIVTKLEGLVLDNVPMLVEVSVKGTSYSIKNLVPALSCCIFQLEILTLQLMPNPELGVLLSKFPEIPKLKKLVIVYWTAGVESLMVLTSLIRASPYLHEFVLKFLRWTCPTSGLDREVRNTIKFPHHHLKVFKFSGYDGCASDVELVRIFNPTTRE